MTLFLYGGRYRRHEGIDFTTGTRHEHKPGDGKVNDKKWPMAGPCDHNQVTRTSLAGCESTVMTRRTDSANSTMASPSVIACSVRRNRGDSRPARSKASALKGLPRGDARGPSGFPE